MGITTIHAPTKFRFSRSETPIIVDRKEALFLKRPSSVTIASLTSSLRCPTRGHIVRVERAGPTMTQRDAHLTHADAAASEAMLIAAARTMIYRDYCILSPDFPRNIAFG